MRDVYDQRASLESLTTDRRSDAHPLDVSSLSARAVLRRVAVKCANGYAELVQGDGRAREYVRHFNINGSTRAAINAMNRAYPR